MGLFALVACLLIPGAAFAATIPFGGANFTWFNSVGGTPNHIWNTGDFWDQTATTALPSAASLGLNLVFDDTSLAQTLNLDVDLNGTIVGSFSIAPGASSFVNTFAFSPISGTDYDIRIIATNTIGSGDGSVSLLADSATSTVTLESTVPELGSLPLVSTGALSILALRRWSQRSGRRKAIRATHPPAMFDGYIV